MKKAEITVFLSLIFLLLLSFIMGVLEAASLQVAKNTRRGDMTVAVESVFAEYQKDLLKDFHIFALEGTYESGSFTTASVLDRLEYYGAVGIETKIAGMELLSDRGAAHFISQALEYVKEKKGLGYLEDLVGELPAGGTGSGEAAVGDAADPEDLLEKAQTAVSESLKESAEQLPAEDNPLAHVSQLQSSSFLTLVKPKEATISNKNMATDSLPSGRTLKTGSGAVTEQEADSGAVARLGVAEYVLEHFRDFTSETTTATILDYEVEYVLEQNGSDAENLEGVAKTLARLRLLPNFAYLQTDAELKAQARTLAATLCTLITLPGITEVVTQAILAAWAYGEGIMDVRSLLAGNKIPLLKTKDDWQLQLAGLLTLGTAEDRNEPKAAASGQDYQDYLRILLALNDQADNALHTLDLIENKLVLEKGRAFFKIDHCISALKLDSVCTLRRNISYQFPTLYYYR